MSDTSKAEKLAAARKKLKQFQQKNKESAPPNSRSTPSSQKSVSPVDNILTVKDNENHVQENNFHLNTENNSSESLPNPCNLDYKLKLTPVYSFQNHSSDNNENFFDNLPQNTFANNGNPPNQNLSVSHVNAVVPDQPVVVDNQQPPMVDDYHSVNNEELLARLAELENQLAFERRNNEEFQRKIMESHGHVLSLQHEIKRLNEERNHIVAKEVVKLEEKLKFQLQTIEILVSEKSELQKELLNLQDENKANISKCEELASRLKASRSQVQKLEKDLSNRSETSSQHNSILKRLETELQQKENIVQDALKNLSDARNQVRELERRIEVNTHDHEELRRQVQDKDKQLSMAQIKLTQLGGEIEGSSLKEIEWLKAELEKSQKEAENNAEEKNKCETELRQYISSLNAQVLQAVAKCERVEKDRDELNARIEELIKHHSALEKQLQNERTTREAAEEPEVVKALRLEVVNIQDALASKVEQIQTMENELEEAREKLSEADRWRENVPDMSLLQAAMESDRVAAARALEQNNTLKQKLTELEEYIIKINNSKLELTEELDKYRHMAGEYRLQLEKFKSIQEMRMVDSVTQTNHIRKTDSVSQTTIHDLIETTEPHEPVTVETLVMIEEKLKKTMDRVADLSDEKQRLEHLVLQLQSETETIGEYVTLYQNQRSLLKEKAEEKERQMALIAKEREELKTKLDQINILLTKFPHNPDVEDTTCKISSLVGEIQSSSIVQEKVGPPPTFHPCLLCSGKLITV